MPTKNWNLVFSFMYLVSVYPMDRTFMFDLNLARSELYSLDILTPDSIFFVVGISTFLYTFEKE